MEYGSNIKKKSEFSSASSTSSSASSSGSAGNAPIIQAHLESQLNTGGNKSNMGGSESVAPWLSSSKGTSAASAQLAGGLQNALAAAAAGIGVVSAPNQTGPAGAMISNLIQTLQCAQAPDYSKQAPKAKDPPGIEACGADEADDPPGIEACGTDEEPPREKKAERVSPQDAINALLSKGAAAAAPPPPVPVPQGQPTPFNFNACYLQLAAFKQLHGHANPTSGHLAGWLACQRVLYRQGMHPSAIQVQLLQAMGAYGFAPPSLAAATNPLLGAAAAAAVANPMLGALGARPPPLTGGRPMAMAGPVLAAVGAPPKAPTGRNLPAIVTTEATTAAAATRNNLNPSHMRPRQTACGRGGTSWEDRFRQLLAYEKRMGNPNPPQTKGSPEADYKLAIWLNSQRQKFRKGTLADDKTQQLLHLGCEGFVRLEEEDGDQKNDNHHKKRKAKTPAAAVVEEPTPPVKRKKVSWNGRYQELCVFKARVGHANPSYGKGSPEACQHLAQWLSNQRSDFRLGKKISLDQVKLLRKLGCRGFDKAPYEQDDEEEEKAAAPPKKIIYPTPQDP